MTTEEMTTAPYRLPQRTVILAVLACCAGLLLVAVLLAMGYRPWDGWGRPFHPTPFDAVKEWPGYLWYSDAYLADSAAVVQQQHVSGGLLLVYRWQAAQSVEAETYCLAATFVTPEGEGWRAQASTSLSEFDRSEGTPRWDCSITDDAFFVGHHVGGNIAPVSAVYGLSPRGKAAHIEWRDGRTDLVSLVEGAFLLARPKTVQVQRIEILGVDGRMMESKQW